MEINNSDYFKFVAPRPTVCVSTKGPNNVSNVAPYSFVSPISMNPPLIGIMSAKTRDTYKNIRENKEFVVTPLTESWMEKGVRTEVSLPRNESEFEEIGLSEKRSEKVSAPGVEEAPVNIECELWEVYDAGDHKIIVGEIVNITGNKEFVKKGRINLEDLGAVGHVCGEEFCLANEITEIER